MSIQQTSGTIRNFDLIGNIAICGAIGSGKSTLAKALQNNFGYTICSFAAPIKEIANKIVGADAPKPRKLLQQLGMFSRMTLEELEGNINYEQLVNGCPEYREFEREWQNIIHNPNFFVNYMKAQLPFQYAWSQGKCVVDDMRFINEGNALQMLNFKLISLTTTEAIRLERILERDKQPQDIKVESDASEIEVRHIGVDKLYTNDDTILNLLQKIINDRILAPKSLSNDTYRLTFPKDLWQL